jgi:hypothetical protein
VLCSRGGKGAAVEDDMYSGWVEGAWELSLSRERSRQDTADPLHMAQPNVPRNHKVPGEAKGSLTNEMGSAWSAS